MHALKSIYTAITLCTLVAVCIISSCKKNGISPQEVAKKRLIGQAWNIKSVTVDGVDKTSMYTGMTITFTATSYSSTNGGVIWPSSGTWSFKSTDGTTLLRNDGTELTVLVADTSLDISLFWPERTLGGRAYSLMGNHKFSFIK